MNLKYSFMIYLFDTYNFLYKFDKFLTYNKTILSFLFEPR